MSTSFQISKAKIGYYAELPATSDVWLCLLLKATGLETNAVMADHDTLASLLAATNDEADFTNYARKQITTVTTTLDDTGDRVLIDVADQTWSTAGGATNNGLGSALLVYDPNPGTSTDTNRIPLLALDITVTTDGNDLTLRFNADGVCTVT